MSWNKHQTHKQIPYKRCSGLNSFIYWRLVENFHSWCNYFPFLSHTCFEQIRLYEGIVSLKNNKERPGPWLNTILVCIMSKYLIRLNETPSFVWLYHCFVPFCFRLWQFVFNFEPKKCFYTKSIWIKGNIEFNWLLS